MYRCGRESLYGYGAIVSEDIRPDVCIRLKQPLPQIGAQVDVNRHGHERGAILKFYLKRRLGDCRRPVQEIGVLAQRPHLAAAVICPQPWRYVYGQIQRRALGYGAVTAMW